MKPTATVVAALVATIELGHATSNSFKEADIEKLCGIATAAQAAAAVALQHVTDLKRRATAAQRAADKLLLAALASSRANESLLFGSAAQVAQDCGKQALELIDSTMPTALAAAATGAGTAGRISEFVSLLQQTTASHGSRHCIYGSGSKSTKTQNLAALKCPSHLVTDLRPQQKLDDSHISDKGFKAFTGSTQIQQNGDNGCRLLKSNDGNADSLWEDASTPNFAAAFITADPHTGTGATSTVKRTDNIAANNRVDNPQDDVDRAYNAIAALNNLPTTSCPATEEEIIKHALTPANLRNVLGQVLLLSYPNLKDQAAGEVTTLTNKVAGATESQEEKLKKIMAKLTVKKLDGTTTKMVEIEKLTEEDIVKNTVAAAVAGLKEAIKEKPKCSTATTNPVSQGSEEANKECSDKKGTACTGDCEWDKKEEKCKPAKKEEGENQEKGGTDGKTNTKTTGSNSFVIHKAPLLLAVFIWGRKIFKIFARIYEIYETCYF
uniref:Variant surface glycoprotein 1125.540 n=1 Tax=Trypanosoma brucei TaxID=5691 RepID=A0A1J0R623_9TRYP|nr:variant surface glycoprotein 1125.540 [Trypanosoma brucei]